MHALMLLLAAQGLPASLPRVPVPARADLAALDAAAKRCTARHPSDDRCYDLYIALGHALNAASRPADALEAVKAGRAKLPAIYADIDDLHSDVTGRAQVQKVAPEQVDPDFPRIAALRKRMWSDAAQAALVEAEAAEAQYRLYEAADRFGAYWSIHTDYVKDPAKAEHALATGLRSLQIRLTAGSADRVESTLAFSLAKAQAAFGRNHPTIVGMWIVRARAQSAMGNYAQAETMFADARSRAAQTGSVRLQADADAAYARHLVAVDRAREALDLQRSVVVRLEGIKAPSARMAQAYLDFAEVSSGQEALDVAARAVDLHVAAYGADHLLTGRARVAAAGLLDGQGYFDQGERERALGLAILAKRLSVLHPEIALAQLRQAENLIQKDRCPEVVRLAGSALDAFIYFGGDGSTADSGKTHPNTARAQFLIGMCELRTRPASGMERLRRAVAIQRVALVPTHPERLHTEMALGLVASAQGDFAAALRQFRTVATAAQERVRSFTGFDAAAQREQREFAPVYRAIIQTAWTASKRS